MSFLQRLRDLDAKATPGPWRVVPTPVPEWRGDYYVTSPVMPEHTSIVTGDDYDLGWDKANAALLVLLRNSAPRLAALVEAATTLRAALDRHVATLSGQFADVDLAVDDFRAALTALDTEPT